MNDAFEAQRTLKYQDLFWRKRNFGGKSDIILHKLSYNHYNVVQR